MMSNDENADAQRAAGKGNGWSCLPSGPQNHGSPLHSHVPSKKASVADRAVSVDIAQAATYGGTTERRRYPRNGGEVGSDRWVRQIGPARLMWDRLSADELAGSRGRRSELADLVQSRYAVTRAAADLQVRTFLQTHAT